MTARNTPHPNYRPCVGLMLINPDGGIFVGKRIDVPGDHWQMPQGGIDSGETPEQAALRELAEEIGTDKAEIIGVTEGWLRYDLPKNIAGKVWRGRYRGQSQRWFALRYTGTDDDIDLNAHKPEFTEWRWAAIDTLVEGIIPFKRDIYRAVVDEFRDLVAAIARDS
jgi:putative (di)nucleoside polyphosphate hydrolase